MSLEVLHKFPDIQIYIPWPKQYAHDRWKMFSSMVFSNFESIYFKYLKSLQSGSKYELIISNKMWQNVFRSEFVSYIFIFLVTYLVYIFLFLYVVIIHLLWWQDGVGIYCKLIPNWIILTQERILFTTQYRTVIQNQIRNTTWIRKQASLYLDSLIATSSIVFSPRVFHRP